MRNTNPKRHISSIPKRHISSITINNKKLPAKTSLKIDAITNNIIRIHTVPSNGNDKDFSFTLGAASNPDTCSSGYSSENNNGFSFAIENPPEISGIFMTSLENSIITAATDSLIIRISKSMQINIYNRNGSLVCSDHVPGNRQAGQLSKEETMQLIQEGHIADTADNNYKYKVTKKIFGDEAFYGLGDKTGFLNKKGYDYIMWNSDNPDPHVENPTFRALYKSIPFFIVHRKGFTYGIFLDNTYKSYFDFGYSDADSYSFAVTNGELNYYFIYGQNIKEVVQRYTSLTGRCPLPQLWTLGYHQSRWSYSSEEEVLSIADNFNKYDIPCDAIHLDIDYMDNFKVFTSNKDRFPDLCHLSNRLYKSGIKLVTIIDPGVKAEEGYHMYDEGIKNNSFAKTEDGKVYHNAVWPGDSVFPDFTSYKTRLWWGDKTKLLLDKGISGIWNDMNEPASFNGPLPDNIVFPGDGNSRLHAEVHNVYGHLMSKATYDGLKKNSQKRPFVITRACYSGSQKYTTVWTGDNQSIWSHLKLAIPQLLNLGLSGIPLAGVDIGGFGSHATSELLCRWIEACCFSPLFRNHSAKMTRRQEPWTFDQETLDIYRKYVKLHYKFIPYLYDLCYEESLTGIPILRPLIMEYEDDPEVINCNDEYLVGSSILVAPVTDQGAVVRSIYLPKGIWIDYHSGKRIKGGKYILYKAPVSICPVFIKGGSILPTYPDIPNLSPGNTDKLIVEFYPSNNRGGNNNSCYYMHYQDNGTDFKYQTGGYNLYKFSFSSNHPGGIKAILIKNGYKNKYTNISAVIK